MSKILQNLVTKILDKISMSSQKLKYKIKPVGWDPSCVLNTTDPVDGIKINNVCQDYNEPFSWTDVKVYLVPRDEKTKIDSGFKNKEGNPFYTLAGNVKTVQTVELWGEENKRHRGSISFIVLDGIEEVESFAGQDMFLSVVANSEYGKTAILFEKFVKFDNYYSWSCGIDDIVTVASLKFSVILAQ
jgi:hypothetical protein